MLLGPVKSFLNTHSKKWEEIEISEKSWNDLLSLISDGKLSFSQAAQKVLPLMLFDATADPIEIAEKLDLIQDADTGQLKQWIEKIIASMPEKVSEYKKGKKGLIGLFVGEVKKISKGKADPKIVTQILEEILNQN